MFRGTTVRFIVLVAAAALCGCSDTPQAPKVESGAVILAFGDSLTRGTGASAAESYPAVLAQLSGREVINAGVPGEISENGLKRLPGLLDEHRPALLILCHGGNDFLRRLDPAATENNVRRMVELARSRDVGVLLLGVPQFGLFLNAAPFYAEIADEAGIPYLGDVMPDIIRDPSLKSDSVHPNAAGYRKMAEAVYQALRDAGAL